VRHTKRTRIVAVAAALVAFALVAAAMPRLPQLSTEVSGDAALIERVRDLATATGARDRLSVAVLEGDDVRVAHFGATDSTEYEIGSVTKTVTGSLLADAIERGEVTADTPLGDLLDLNDSPAASIPLEELATHSSGLPRLSSSVGQFVSAFIGNLRASDPYGASVDELVDRAADTDLGEGEFGYSNFGFALLGQALAASADTGYGELAAERVFAPLGMRDTFAPDSADDLEPDAPTGYTASGRRSDAWTLGADAPAGSVRSTLADMVTYVRAQRDGTAPGVAATEPVAAAGAESRIGYAWITTDGVTWHNGGTGGFTSWVGFDRETGRAVVVLNNTAVSVDELGLALMEEN
jgi:CubicO group peptidase (beta-lactamase class C family)